MAVTSYDIATTFYTIIVGDATMIGAQHLNGTNKVRKNMARPAEVANPTLTIDVRGESHAGESGRAAEQVLVRLRLFMDVPASGTVDGARVDRIGRRLQDLFDEKRLAGATNSIMIRQCVQLRLMEELYNEEVPAETMFLTDFRVWAN